MANGRSVRSTGYVDLEDEYAANGGSHDSLNDYDCYGQTPPRTRILRKYKERKQKDKEAFGFTMSKSPNLTRSKKLGRRNTVSIIFDELMAKADSTDTESGKRNDKRVMKLLRGSERDLKLDIVSAQSVGRHDNGHEEIPKTPLPSVQVEGCKRFKSLCSRLVTIPKIIKREPLLTCYKKDDVEICGCPQTRVDFHNTLSLLVKMGLDKQMPERSTRRNMSREETIWQNELKDLIWLELQAWHADRTPVDQDNYLCLARDSVGGLLDDIMSYRYEKEKKRDSIASHDSGVEEDCSGCLSMYCQNCLESQNQALKDVECLLDRLEKAEALFPSSSAFGEIYPLYVSPEFVGRVKAMCLWYNMTKHQRLKLVILGRLLALLDNKYYQWPSAVLYDGDSIDSTSPSDSNSSNSSINDFLTDKGPFDLFNITPLSLLLSKNLEHKTSPYRKYIENILKTKGLNKSMSFLERLHNHVLRKAIMTLKKPESEKIFSDEPGSEYEELIRYGAWSPEAKSLGLPSYRSSFLFLSCVPLEVTHEFLRMRLEQKPENPSPLSIRQLMRELKEGLKIAILHRQRSMMYLDIAFNDTNESRDKYTQKLVEYENSLFQVFKLYLQYIEQWSLLFDPFQKQFLEEEWHFVSEISKEIPRSENAAGKKFSSIITTMLNTIGDRLIERIEELCMEMSSKDDTLNNKQTLFALCREFQAVFNEEREITIKTVSFTKNLFKQNIDPIYLDELKKSVVALKCCIPTAIDKVQTACDSVSLDNLEESEKLSLLARWREILSQGYRFGFEFYKEMSEFVPVGRRERLAKSMAQFAHLWMKFVKDRCERGRGKRPQWAYQGLDFLLAVCEPHNTKYLSNEEFDELRTCMDECISHVIGTTAPSTPESGFHSSSPRLSLPMDITKPFTRSRASSPSPLPNYKSQRSTNRKVSTEYSPVSDTVDSPVFMKKTPRSERIKDAIEALENNLEENLRDQELIGRVLSKQTTANRSHIRRRYVSFTWQRGIKIGQGRFGKVYTAVNNNTGEMMAMKEIALQHNDMHTIRRVAEELKILEGIVHKNLVKYYGLEVHREEMLIFMEFCAEGTLESLAAGTEGGLPELLIRKYTYQLVSGVAVLHDHGIVHRDIKSANIFLNDEGDLKIGDFGCATQIKANTTMPGELQGFVGTQAYMAPEMFMKTSSEGHGRAADIWSVGCVVVEMASGERPWAQYDSNYQIMFKVGMGERPQAPETLIKEGHDFLNLCLQHDPKDRASAIELLNHDFVKVGEDIC